MKFKDDFERRRQDEQAARERFEKVKGDADDNAPCGPPWDRHMPGKKRANRPASEAE